MNEKNESNIQKIAYIKNWSFGCVEKEKER